MFGMELPKDHGDRYAYSQEWFDVVARTWSSPAPFEFHGRFFKLAHVSGDPKPYAKRPPILNAGGSAEGQKFAQRNADVLFTAISDLGEARGIVANIKRLSKEQYGREVLVYVVAYVVCRRTQAEADAYHEHYAVTHADGAAAERLLSLSVKHTKTLPPDVLKGMQKRMAAGHGGYPLVGDADSVAAGLNGLVQAGFDGVSLGFVNYLEELPYFIQEVLLRFRR